jgi:hypothetical protein
MARGTSPMTNPVCNCIEKVNLHLAAFNTRLLTAWFGPQGAMLCTEKVDAKERGKKKEMFASFCPFCGARYEESKDA